MSDSILPAVPFLAFMWYGAYATLLHSTTTAEYVIAGVMWAVSIVITIALIALRETQYERY